MLVIVGNVVALATYHYDMGPDQRHRLDQASRSTSTIQQNLIDSCCLAQQRP
jgi:hypothetical protein